MLKFDYKNLFDNKGLVKFITQNKRKIPAAKISLTNSLIYL